MDYESVFELAVPISDLRITTGESINILVGRTPYLGAAIFNDPIPNVDRVTYEIQRPPTQPWSRTWGGTEEEYDRDVAVDGVDIYMAGRTDSFGSGERDAFLAKYSLPPKPTPTPSPSPKPTITPTFTPMPSPSPPPTPTSTPKPEGIDTQSIVIVIGACVVALALYFGLKKRR